MPFRPTHLAALLLLFAAPAAADEAAASKPWTDSAEISVVMTSGNAENTNLSLNNKFIYRWGERSDLTINSGALRTETTTLLYDVDPDDTSRAVVAARRSAVTAERYFADGKFRRAFRDGSLWYASAGWERNEFAGIDARWSGSSGLGYRFFKTDRRSLEGEFGATLTDESYTDPTAAGQEGKGYVGARGFLAFHERLSETAAFDGELELLDDLGNTTDLRARLLTALSARLSTRLAMKLSYTINFDNEPAFRTVSVPVASNPSGKASIELDEIDTVLSASFVIDF